MGLFSPLFYGERKGGKRSCLSSLFFFSSEAEAGAFSLDFVAVRVGKLYYSGFGGGGEKGEGAAAAKAGEGQKNALFQCTWL